MCNIFSCLTPLRFLFEAWIHSVTLSPPLSGLLVFCNWIRRYYVFSITFLQMLLHWSNNPLIYTDIMYHKITHFRVLFFFSGTLGSSTASIASSNTSLSPFFVSAEHSTYELAPSFAANLSPSSGVMGFCRRFCSFCLVCSLSRRSFCVPTSRNGALGTLCLISGTHFCSRFFIDSGITTENATRNTCVSV